jgi:hypothetical protein
MEKKNSDKPKKISDEARQKKINRRRMAKKSRVANKRKKK